MKITADTTVLVRALGQEDPEQVPAHQGLGPAKKAMHSENDVTDISETPEGFRWFKSPLGCRMPLGLSSMRRLRSSVAAGPTSSAKRSSITSTTSRICVAVWQP